MPAVCSGLPGNNLVNTSIIFMNIGVEDNMNCKDYKSNNWLNGYAKTVTSQHGEDGIIEKILEIISDNDKWCVEFGSWDGKKLSNTYNLITNKEYSGILIEGDKKRFKDLLKTFHNNPKVVPVNTFVGFNENDNLDTILKNTEIPINFDLLSIDVDGNDYHLWDAVRKYRPKIVVIEFNPTIPPHIEFVQQRDMKINQGSSILSITKLAKSKGYELIASTSNAIYVDAQYFNLFGIKDNSVEEIWTDRSSLSYLFFGYDGTVFKRGLDVHPWQKVAIDESKMQLLPKWARKKHCGQNYFVRKLAKYYRNIMKVKS
jgi:hypothetical protein